MSKNNTSSRLIQICRESGMGMHEAKQLVYSRDAVTLRDKFAMKAMQGLIANRGIDCQPFTNDQLAQWSFVIADAMLAEREK